MIWPLVPAGSLGSDISLILAGFLPLSAIVYAALRFARRESRFPRLLALIGILVGILWIILAGALD